MKNIKDWLRKLPRQYKEDMNITNAPLLKKVFAHAHSGTLLLWSSLDHVRNFNKE